MAHGGIAGVSFGSQVPRLGEAVWTLPSGSLRGGYINLYQGPQG